MRMICSKDNGKGMCVAARGADGREIVVVGAGLKSGAYMTCVDRGNMVDCQQFPEAVGTLSSPCLFISRYVKLKPHPARLSSFPIGGFYGNRGT
jgi:hypothetical protein